MRARLSRTVASAVVVAALCIPQLSLAALGDCAQPVTDGPGVAATDCLFILRVAVGTSQCSPACLCAPKGTLPTTATDALICLNVAVGGPTPLDCPCGGAAESAGGFVDSIDIPFVDIDQDYIITDCCKDFGPISRDFIEESANRIDNSLAGLTALMNAAAATDVNTSVNRDIAAGEIVLLLDHRGIDTASVPDPFELAFLHGTFAPGTDFTAASAGDGEFLVDPESYVPGTSTPKNVFASAEYDSAAVTASGGTFEAVIPFGGTTIDVAIHDAEIDGAHSGVTATGLGYESAQVAGYVFPEELVIAINDFVGSDNCSCLGLTEALFTKDAEDAWVATGCIADAESRCPRETKASCIVLADAFDSDDENAIGFCEFIPDVMFLFADLDLDGDTATFESVSAGIRFTTAPGVISGVITP